MAAQLVQDQVAVGLLPEFLLIISGKTIIVHRLNTTFAT